MNNRTPHPASKIGLALCTATMLAGCATLPARETAAGMRTASEFPVTSNDTPYSRCLTALAGAPGSNLPAIAVDKQHEQSRRACDARRCGNGYLDQQSRHADVKVDSNQHNIGDVDSTAVVAIGNLVDIGQIATVTGGPQ